MASRKIYCKGEKSGYELGREAPHLEPQMSITCLFFFHFYWIIWSHLSKKSVSQTNKQALGFSKIYGAIPIC